MLLLHAVPVPFCSPSEVTYTVALHLPTCPPAVEGQKLLQEKAVRLLVAAFQANPAQVRLPSGLLGCAKQAVAQLAVQLLCATILRVPSDNRHALLSPHPFHTVGHAAG